MNQENHSNESKSFQTGWLTGSGHLQVRFTPAISCDENTRRTLHAPRLQGAPERTNGQNGKKQSQKSSADWSFNVIGRGLKVRFFTPHPHRPDALPSMRPVQWQTLKRRGQSWGVGGWGWLDQSSELEPSPSDQNAHVT